MISALLQLLKRIPQPYRLIVLVVLVLIVGGLFFLLIDQVSSCRYNKGRAEYTKEREQWTKDREAWTTERAGLIATAEANERRIAELEPKAIAFDALADQNKRIDSQLANQIDEVSKNAANEESNALLATDCITRANRVCERLRANRIAVDCAKLTAESCTAR